MTQMGPALCRRWPRRAISCRSRFDYPAADDLCSGRLGGARRRLPHLRPLCGDDALRLFADAYEQASGYRVPEAYLRSSQVLGMVIRGRLIGGGVLSRAVPLRTLQRLPEPERNELSSRLAGRCVVDLTCVWLRAGRRGGALSGLFWCDLLRRIQATGAEVVLFGTEQPGLYRFYRTTHADLLYHGPVTVDGQERVGWVFLKENGSLWPVLVRMALYRVGRRARRRIGVLGTLLGRGAEGGRRSG
jgi:hypothetical protein